MIIVAIIAVMLGAQRRTTKIDHLGRIKKEVGGSGCENEELYFFNAISIQSQHMTSYITAFTIASFNIYLLRLFIVFI